MKKLCTFSMLIAIAIAFNLSAANNPPEAPWASYSVKIYIPLEENWHPPLLVSNHEVEYYLIKLASNLNSGYIQLTYVEDDEGTRGVDYWDPDDPAYWSYTTTIEAGSWITYIGKFAPSQWNTRVGVGIIIDETLVWSTSSIAPTFTKNHQVQ